MIAAMDSVIVSVMDQWLAHQGPLDMSHASCSLALRVVARTLFGQEAGPELDRCIQAIDEVQARLSERIWAATPLGEWFPSEKNRRFKAAIQEVVTVVQDIIRQRKQSKAEHHDLLSALINAVDSEGKPFTEQQVLDEVITIFWAGHETTGNTLAWMWENLALDPALQARVRAEVLEKIPLDQTPTAQQLKALPYTHALLQETMRLKPSAWWFARTAVEDDVIMGYPIKAGDGILVCQYATHRLAEFWPEPDFFDITRFLGERKASHKFAFIPFGAGQRVCPAGHFASTEMALIIARALARMVFSPVEPAASARPYEALVTLRPHDGMPMTVTPYQETLFLKQNTIGDHSLIDAVMRIRSEVFIQRLKWPLKADDEGREHDQFDTADAGYVIVVDSGRILGSARLLPCEKPTLLYDVFPYLITDAAARKPKAGIYEGSRLVIKLHAHLPQSRHAHRLVLAGVVNQAVQDGISHIYTVSDPVMERVLSLVGAMPERLGIITPTAEGNGVALALKITCTPDIVARIRSGFLTPSRSDSTETREIISQSA
jgi:cytochrome P450/N-acyl-L-homoserine lactone synthetase